MIRRLLALVLFALSATAPAAQEVPDLSGRWQAVYDDRVLGAVPGVIRIDGDRVEAVYGAPGGGGQVRLTGVVAERGALGIRIELDGASPTGDGDPVRLAEPVKLAGTAGAMVFEIGGARLEVPVLRPGRIERDHVTLRMRPDPDGRHIDGEWSYRADPDGGRDGAGRGRSGDFQLLEDGSGEATQSGFETWRRPAASIDFATVSGTPIAEDPAAGPYMRYPFPLPGARDLPTGPSDRRILVLGRELPEAWSDAAVFVSDDPAIDYVIEALPDMLGGPAISPWVDRAWEGIEAAYPPETLRLLRARQAVLVRAILKPGIRPGLKGFSLNGAEASWLLEFGDFAGEIAAVRFVSETETERAPYAFLPETVSFEIRADRVLPLDEVPLVIGRDGALLRFGAGRIVPARRIAPESTVYRTAPIRILRAGDPATGGLEIRAESYQRIEATLAAPGLVRLRPVSASVTVLDDPLQVGILISGQAGSGSLSFRDALDRTAACHRAAYTNPATFAGITADRVSNLMLVSPGLREIPVKMGDQAALILFRQAFLELIDRTIAEHRRIAADPALALAFYKREEPASYLDAGPFGRWPVRAPDGSTLPYQSVLGERWLGLRYGLSGAAFEAYAVAATREMLAAFVAAAEQSRADVAGVEDCDLGGLLQYLATGNAGLSRMLAPRLLVRAPGGWTPDRVARSWTRSVDTLGEAIRAQSEVSKLDTQVALMTLALVSFPLTLTDATAATIASIALDVTDFGISLYTEAAETWSSRSEFSFMQGAVTVMGYARFTDAEAARKSWLAPALSVVGPAAGIVSGGLKLWRGPGGAKAIERGMARAEGLTTDELRALPRADQEDILAAALEARLLAGRLTRASMLEGELEALRIADELAAELDAPQGLVRPDWAEGIAEATYLRLVERNMAHRADVQALVARAGRGIEPLLDDNGLAALFRDPFDDLADFARARQRLAARADTSMGRAAYDAIVRDPAARVDGVWIERSRPLSFERGSRRANAVAYFGADAKVGHYTRYLDFRDEGATLTMQALWTDPGVRRLLSVPFPDGNGMPLSTYLNLSAMGDLGLAYADPVLRFVDVGPIAKSDTLVQLDWLRRTYGGLVDANGNRLVSDFDLIRNTPTYDYVETALTQAGYRITGGRIEGGFDDFQTVAREVSDAENFRLAGTGGRPFDPGRYLRLRGYRGDEGIEGWLHFVLEVEPVR